MATQTGGILRWVIKNANSTVVAISPQFSALTANNTSTPRIVFNRPGTANDENYDWRDEDGDMVVARGNAGEFWELQYLEATARTLTTANCVFTFGVRRFYKAGADTKSIDPQHVLGDRMTKSTASTINDSRGLNDNPVTVANEWSPIERVPVIPGTAEALFGFERILVDAV